jgi:beta-glucanase (GH16 family)
VATLGIAGAASAATLNASTDTSAKTVASTAAAASVPAPPSGFTTTWSDDFSGSSGSGVDGGNWKYDTGPGSSFGTGEIETMSSSKSNVYRDGSGHLIIKATHSGSNPGTGWTSGRIESQAATFGAPAGGVVEMVSSIEQPNLTKSNGAGYWPAFWMLGSPLRSGVTWPKSGEVDILEDINSRSSVFGTLHCGVNPGGPCNESTGIGSGERACSGCQTGYHTYAVQIDRSTSPEQIRWYLDGSNYFTVKSDQVDAGTWSNAVDHPFYIIYDLAMGGSFPNAFGGGPNSSTAGGGEMKVDYVAVYNKAPAGSSGASGHVTSGISGKCLDDYAGGTANGTKADVWDCNSSSTQKWQFTGGNLKIKGKCLDVTGGKTADGTLVELWDCNGSGAQVWQKGANNSLVNPASGKCLDDPRSSTVNGTQLDIWSCNGGANQKWTTP